MKVTVVGAGIMGLSAAWALERSGHRVTVLDQAPVPNPRGASSDQHRLIRYPYGTAVGYTAMVAEAYRAWDELWADLGESLYVPTGTLAVGAFGTSWVRDSADALQAIGLTVEWLDPGRVSARFPLLRGDAIAAAFSRERVPSLTSRPPRASSTATAVPQLPAPITAAFRSGGRPPSHSH